MRIDPGGRLEMVDIVGGDGKIRRYWSILDRQGLVLSAERRIGKTQIALKMMDECRIQQTSATTSRASVRITTSRSSLLRSLSWIVCPPTVSLRMLIQLPTS
jgi:hypothetical protein